jgi:hypothetical protein
VGWLAGEQEAAFCKKAAQKTFAPFEPGFLNAGDPNGDESIISNDVKRGCYRVKRVRM